MPLKPISAALEPLRLRAPLGGSFASKPAHGRQNENARGFQPRPYHRSTSQRAWSWRPLDRNDRARIIYLAERFEAQTRVPGSRRHGGALKRTGLEVLRVLLFHYLNPKTGRLDPSLDAIAKRAAMCRQTVVSALARLRAAGFVSWIQRVVVVDRGRQRQAVQITNAYKIGQAIENDSLRPSAWRDSESESNNCTESTSPDFPKSPTDEPLRQALRALAHRLGWTEERLEECGLGG